MEIDSGNVMRRGQTMRLIDADLLIQMCKEWLEPKAPDEDKMVSLADIAVSVLMESEG